MKQYQGKVISKKMAKTALVEVVSFRTHPVYRKRIKTKKNYPTHDQVGTKVGQRVVIQETRPVSKTKKWKVVKVLEKDQVKNKNEKSKSKGEK